jgi:hypothetical protein
MECVAKKNFKESIKSLEAFKAAQLNMKVSVFLCYRVIATTFYQFV